MNRKNSRLDTQLIQVIRGMIKEELDRYLPGNDHPLAVSGSSDHPAPKSGEEPENISPPRLADDFGDGPWAIFGAPEPDPGRKPYRSERPRALPGWSEPYRPDFTGFDSPPPFLNNRPAKPDS